MISYPNSCGINFSLFLWNVKLNSRIFKVTCKCKEGTFVFVWILFLLVKRKKFSFPLFLSSVFNYMGKSLPNPLKGEKYSYLLFVHLSYVSLYLFIQYYKIYLIIHDECSRLHWIKVHTKSCKYLNSMIILLPINNVWPWNLINHLNYGDIF